MEISFQDRSNYFNGTLLLMGREVLAEESEKNSVRRLGKILDFEPQFCEYVISHFLDDTFTIQEPVKFSNPEIAKIFIRDGIKICFANQAVKVSKVEMLYKIAVGNHLSAKWFARELYDFLDKGESEVDHLFEIARFFKIKYKFDINRSAKDHREFMKPIRLTSNL